LQFGVYAGAAREEKKNVYIHPAGIESMIDECSTGNRWTPKLATTLFEILIPVDFKEQLKRQGNITWILDKNTAAYPWELLQDNTADAKPLSVNAGMIRQLDTMDYRLKINIVTGNTALVVGEPELDGFLTPLPGALQEAKAVADIIEQNGFMPTRLFKSNARDILQELHAGYKIVHLAGHGVFNKDAPQYSGMVIGKNYFLTTADISNMSTVPELVFLNCCHLGRTDGGAEAYYQNVYKMAANIGTQLIENGVKVVVAAGWAVSDAAALRFAQLFYEGMFDGDCFGDAVKKARAAIYEAFPRTNTWGAYQCYGDPFYKFRNEQKKKIQPAREFMIAAEAEIALDNLESAIKTGKYKQEQIPDELMEIATAVDKAGIRQAAITEREARLYSDLHHYDLAIAKFESLLSIEKADFAVSSLEKYYNTRMKKYIADYINEAAHENGINEANLKSWQTNTNEVLQGLESLLLISATAERYNLLGSTFKRKGILCINKTEKLQAYSRAAYYYHKANEKQHYNKGYALTNWYALESVLVLAADRSWSEIIQKEDQDAYILPAKEEVIKKLAEIKSAYTPNMQKMDYWVMIQVPNCMLCLLIVNSDTNEQVWNDVLNAYHDVWSKAGAQGDKFAEIEHLQLMADALQLNSTNNAALIKKLDSLKDDLQKMI